MTPYDIVLTVRVGTNGRTVGHRLDCPAVEVLRSAGEPLLTFLKCERPPPPDVVLHGCWFEAPP